MKARIALLILLATPATAHRLDEYLQKLKANRNKKQPKEKPHVHNSIRKR